jgi:hypothetical protein
VQSALPGTAWTLTLIALAAWASISAWRTLRTPSTACTVVLHHAPPLLAIIAVGGLMAIPYANADQDYFSFVRAVAPQWRQDRLVVLNHEEHLIAALAVSREPLPVAVADLPSAVAVLRADPLRRLLVETTRDVLSARDEMLWSELRRKLALPDSWALIEQPDAGRRLAALGLIEEQSWNGPAGRHYVLLRLASRSRSV